jgi:hypothetical protein
MVEVRLMTPFLSVMLVAFPCAVLLAGLPLFIMERRWRWRWNEVEVGRLPTLDTGATPFRESSTVPDYMRRAPAQLRFTAFTCFLFGQMFIPGLIMGAFGLLAGGIGLVSIPGLITAAKIYSTGLALLRRSPREAYFKARNAAAWALWLNGVIAAGSVLLTLTPLRPSHAAGWLFMAAINFYGLLSMLQAWLMQATVARYEDALFAPTRAAAFGERTYPIEAAA